MLSSGKKWRCSCRCQMSHPESHIFQNHSAQHLSRHMQHNAIRDTGDQGTPANPRPGFGTQHYFLSADSNTRLLLPSPWPPLVKPLHPGVIHWGIHRAAFMELCYRRLDLWWLQCSQSNLSLLILPVTSLSIWQHWRPNTFLHLHATHTPSQNVTFPPLVFRCSCKYSAIERFIEQTYVPGYYI